MPVLQKSEDILRVYLPSTDGLPHEERAWVDVRSRLLVGDVERITQGKTDEANAITGSIRLLSGMVRDWNYTDAEGQKLPVTEENLRLLETQDLQAIGEHLEKQRRPAEASAEEKKRSFSGSLPETKETRTA